MARIIPCERLFAQRRRRRKEMARRKGRSGGPKEGIRRSGLGPPAAFERRQLQDSRRKGAFSPAVCSITTTLESLMFDTWASYESTRAFVTSSFLWQRRGSDFPLLARTLPEVMKTTRFLAGLPLEKVILAKRCRYPRPRQPQTHPLTKATEGSHCASSRWAPSCSFAPQPTKKRRSPDQPALSFLSFANAFLALFARGSSRTTSGAVRMCERIVGKARPPWSGNLSRSGRSPAPTDACPRP